MAQTVEQVLTRATDSVTLINSINTDGSSSNFWFSVDVTQEEINEMVQRNVDHLEIILAYAPVDEDDDTPDVVGDSSDKSSYTDAITTGKAYIAAN
jgi:SPX domain protein involved in polyphosphate accumulation